MLAHCLESVAKSEHKDWELFLCDDGSPVSGRPILEDILGTERTHYFNTDASVDDKITNGIQIGQVGNSFLSQASGEVAITLADDDELVPTYLSGLDKFFTERPSVMYAWSKVYMFNPLFECSGGNNLAGNYNNFEGSINPTGKVDTSQVAFRVSCFTKHGVRYPVSTRLNQKPALGNIDAPFFEQLYERFGEAPFTGLVGQYKGVHDFQLVWHKKKNDTAFRTYLETVLARGTDGLL
jgi:glycosyltransferase involved in cell wall biosynthesis